jgi:ribonuclease P protein component
MSLSLPRAVRLRRRPEFLAVQDRGRRVSARYFTVIAAPGPVGHDRLGITASRRVGGAVVRNRIKRQVRELFRCQPPADPARRARAGLDIVVIARGEAAGAPFAALRAEFERALERLGRGRS